MAKCSWCAIEKNEKAEGWGHALRKPQTQTCNEEALPGQDFCYCHLRQNDVDMLRVQTELLAGIYKKLEDK